MPGIYACYEYDPVHDLDIAYQLRAENLPGVVSGKLKIEMANKAD